MLGILPDFIGVFNHPVPGDPDPQITRIVIVLFVMAVAFRWSQQMRSSWRTRSRARKREGQWLTALLVVNGILLIAAAQRDDPVRIATVLLGVVFAGLAGSLYLRFANDESVRPVYPHLYPRALLSRFR